MADIIPGAPEGAIPVDIIEGAEEGRGAAGAGGPAQDLEPEAGESVAMLTLLSHC